MSFDERDVAGPAIDLVHGDQEQQRCIDGAIVGSVTALGDRTFPNLVHDLARLGIDDRVINA